MNKGKEVIPLPDFVREYLQKKGAVLRQNPDVVSPQETEAGLSMNQNSKASYSIELLSSSETPSNVWNAYKTFITKIVLSQPPFLQNEYKQFIFPVFILLAKRLFDAGFESRALEFVNQERYKQPSETQPIIQSFLDNPRGFEIAPGFFVIKINKEARANFMIEIDNIASDKEISILSAVITSPCIKIVECKTNSEFIFTNDSEASMIPGNLPLLQLVPRSLKPFSATYSCEGPPSKPMIQEDDVVLVHQNFPDIANIEVLNHDNQVNNLIISNNSRLYSYTKGNNVYITSIDEVSSLRGKKTDILVSHKDIILATAFSYCSRLFASAGIDHLIKISNLEAFIPLMKINAGTQAIYSLAFDPKSAFIAAGSGDRTVSVYNLRDGKILRKFLGHTLPVTKLVFSSDSRRIVSASEDMTIRVWDLYAEPSRDGRKPNFNIATIHIHSEPTALDIDSTNAHIIIGMRDGSVALWDTQKGVRLWECKELDAPVTDVKVTLDGTIVVASSLDGIIKMWRCDDKGEALLRVDATSSTIDTIRITERNSILTAGRSLRGDVRL